MRVKWRTGEEHVGNLPSSAGQRFERTANTAYVVDGFGCYQERMASTCKLSLEDGPASHQLVGEVMAHQG